MNMNSNLYVNKKSSYYAEWREDIFSIIKSKGKFDKSLEIGCASGRLSSSLKREKIVKYAVGVEPYSKPVNDICIDEFRSCFIEDILEEVDEKECFDLIILADVLEHTQDPWKILSKLSKNKLSRDGTVVISLPNIRNFLSLKKIIFNGSFEYEEEGVFDKTHLRFFCIKDMVRLIESAGLELVEKNPAYLLKSYKFFNKNRLRIINAFTLGLFKWFLADQVILVCKKYKI